MSYSNREKLMNYVQTPPQNDNYVALIILSSTVPGCFCAYRRCRGCVTRIRLSRLDAASGRRLSYLLHVGYDTFVYCRLSPVNHQTQHHHTYVVVLEYKQ